MSNEDGSENKDKTEPSPVQALEEKVERLEGLQDNLSLVLTDPAVQAVIAARERGEDVTVTPADKKDDPPEDDNAPLITGDPDDLRPSELLKVMGKMTERSLSRLLKPISDRLDSVEGFTHETQTSSLRQEIAQAKKEFPDFDEHKGKMAEIRQENPGMSIKELYLIAQVRDGRDLSDLGAPPKKKRPSPTTNPGSERPSSSAGERKTGKEYSVNKQPKDRPKSFDEALAGAVDRTAQEIELPEL